MKLNFLVLGIPSLVQLYLIIRHLFIYRRREVAISFLVFGFIFGILRSQIIHFIQGTINGSLVPYQFKNTLLRLGNDSLQVYIGWIITAYLAWCFGEMLVKRIGVLTGNPKLKNNLFALLACAFVFIAAFSYMIETAASYMKWWSWNEMLEAGFASSFFVNVPWVGIVDWGTVAIEFLGLFLVGWHIYATKEYKFSILALFPFLHWGSHLRFENLYWNVFGHTLTVAIIAHLLIPVFIVSLLFIKSPTISVASKISYKLPWLALLISFAVCLGSDIIVGRTLIGLVSLIPMVIIMAIAYGVDIKKIYYGSAIIATSGLIAIIDPLDRKRLIMAFFPIIFLSIVILINQKRLKLQ